MVVGGLPERFGCCSRPQIRVPQGCRSYGEVDAIVLGPRAARRPAATFHVEDRETIQAKGEGWITPGLLVGLHS